MSHTYKKVQPKPFWAIDKTSCDLCGQQIVLRPSYSADEVLISAKEGESYPEGEASETTEADVCLPCWKGKIRPALEALGLKFHTFDTELGRTRSEVGEP